MYKVYCDDILIYDTNDEDLALISPTLTLEDNSVGGFEFTVNPNHPYYNSIEKMNSKIFILEDDEEIFEGRIVEEKSDFYKRKRFYAEGELAYLNDTIQPPTEYHDLTIRGYLETLLNIHNSKVTNDKKFYIGMVTVHDTNDSIYKYTNWESTLDVIKTDLLKTFGGHLRIRKENGKRYLDYLKDYPRTTNQVIRFGENLLDFSKNFDLTNICTVVIPLGAKQDESSIPALEEYLTIESVNDGKKYIVNEEAVKIYGWIEQTVKFNDVHTPQNLLTKGQNFLKNQQYDNMILEIKAIDLHLLNPEIDKIKMLDEVRAYSEIHRLDKFFPLVKMKIELDKPSNSIYTLGNKVKKSLTDSTNSNSSNIESGMGGGSGGGNQGSIIDKDSILTEAQQNASELIHNALNGHVSMSPDELLIMDTDSKDTARKVWRWNLNGLGYSSNGYNGTYGLAITMDGQIVGERIVAGSINADKLDVAYKTSVEHAIQLSEQNSNGYTDGKLKDYYTKGEVTTAIENTKNSILLQAKEDSKAYVDGKLIDYVTSSQLKVTTDSITSEVNKKVDSSEFGTKIEQNSDSVKIAWNNISEYISFENSEIVIRGDDSAEYKSFMKLSSYGLRFYSSPTPSAEPTISYSINMDGEITWYDHSKTSKNGNCGIFFSDYQYNNVQCVTYLLTGLDGIRFMIDSQEVALFTKENIKFDTKKVTTKIMEFENKGSYSTIDGDTYYSMFFFYDNKDVLAYNTAMFKFFTDVNMGGDLDMEGHNIFNQSDARLKINIEDSSVNALDVINNIELKSFDWVDTNTHEELGVIAQQLEEVAPSLTTVDENNVHKIKIDKFVFYCMKAIQELSEELGIRQNKKSQWVDEYTLEDKLKFAEEVEKRKDEQIYGKK